MKKITKAVITAGGYATRFLPITKAVPKEMLPLGDKPVIHYILQELQTAGITDVLLLMDSALPGPLYICRACGYGGGG